MFCPFFSTLLRNPFLLVQSIQIVQTLISLSLCLRSTGKITLKILLGVRSDLQYDRVNPYWKLALVFKALTDTIILDDFKTCLDRLRTQMFDSSRDGSAPGPSSHSQKDYRRKETSATITSPTAQNSSHIVTTQTPKVSTAIAMFETGANIRIQPPGTVRRTMSRIGTHISPLQNAYQKRPDIHPFELSPKPVIHVKTDFSLDKFAKNGSRSASVPGISPLEPLFPRAERFDRGRTASCHAAVSMDSQNSGSSMPTLAEDSSNTNEISQDPSNGHVRHHHGMR